MKVSKENGVVRPIIKNYQINSYDLHSLFHFKEFKTVESSAGKYGIKTLICLITNNISYNIIILQANLRFRICFFFLWKFSC